MRRTSCQRVMSLTFIWPTLLWGFLLIPLSIYAYVRFLQRRPRYPVKYSTFATLHAATAQIARSRRHFPAVLILGALMTTIAAAARPVMPLPVPADRAAIVLALDVSGSMRSGDILPSRLEAAKAAAKDFVSTLPARVRVGFVVFAGYAALLAPPGTDHERVMELIDGVRTARRTAIGDGLIEAVAALPERVRPAPDGSLPPVPSGPLPPGMVILLSDGQNNAGIDPLQAAEIARRQQVTVYTVGMGRPYRAGGWTIGGPLDEETLQAIANVTGGMYYQASSAERLHGIYRSLARMLGWERKPTEVTAVASGMGALLLLAALAASWLLIHPLGT